MVDSSFPEHMKGLELQAEQITHDGDTVSQAIENVLKEAANHAAFIPDVYQMRANPAAAVATVLNLVSLASMGFHILIRNVNGNAAGINAPVTLEVAILHPGKEQWVSRNLPTSNKALIDLLMEKATEGLKYAQGEQEKGG